MSFFINEFINKSVQDVAVRERIDTSQFINLSNNEMVHYNLNTLINKFSPQYNWERVTHYPLCIYLRRKVANLYHLTEDQVLLSAGTDNAIAQILSYFSFASKTLVLQSPNYFNYENYAHVFGLKIYPVEFYSLRDEEIISRFKVVLEKAKHMIVVVTSPHVYTGSCLSQSVIDELLRVCLDNQHLLIIDEAYQAFSTSDNLFYIRDGWPNVIVLRSFSKAFGVAGMRIGGIFADHQIINLLKKVGIFGCINDTAIMLLSFLIDHYDEILQIRADLKTTRDETGIKIKSMFPKWQVLPSLANFITLIVDNVSVSDSIHSFMRSNGILIKQLKGIDQFHNGIRITVSDREIMDKLITQFKKWAEITEVTCQSIE